ncbi:TetR/AcrR family transcriptional regulator C-terminal domain-containing protein [Amycolatopsis sp. WAC 01416]|uniref:TetR/AcrR family transcriptional regulator C-terminal domain-containing protein n=1 Tax=Amycolatopsis sp. WAC 01416 TaxID=2203196 RepID=UPI001F35F291|nr:TetR/AcrR family transcriptional regulator C-terminal domain-containing protein [Amycolatopsis sp. WAC 01416]
MRRIPVDQPCSSSTTSGFDGPRRLGVCSVVPEAPPRERVLALVRAFREALLTHRDGARVYAGTHATGPNTLGLADSLVGALREAGFDAVAALEGVAAHAFHDRTCARGAGDDRW